MRAAIEHANQRIGEACHGRLLSVQKIHHVVLQRGDALHAHGVICRCKISHQRGGILLREPATPHDRALRVVARLVEVGRRLIRPADAGDSI